MQFQLPQFIETEDKLMNMVSFKQFGILGATGGVIAMLYFILTMSLWFIISIPIAAIGLSFAFVRVNGQPFSRIASGAFRYFWGPQIYVWKPEQPHIQKPDAAQMHAGEGAPSMLENIVAGAALKTAWREVQTGSKSPPALAAKQSFEMMRERYEVFHRISGERHAARRIDYR